MSPSPRSSVEATQSPTSPFLHNLHQRLRKGSNASRASSLSSEATQGNAETPQDPRSSKAYLASIVKDDWEYPDQTIENTKTREPIHYRLRDESASEYESSSVKGPQTREEDPYKFDNPDDVGAIVERRRARRRRLLDQEMTWNDGLRVWASRRDAWVGAVTQRPKPVANETSIHKSRSKVKNSSSSSIDQHTRSPSTSSRRLSIVKAQHNGSSVESVPEDDDDTKDGPYLPIYPPLFSASHALRSRIKQSAYPALYSKVVIQSLTPNVPIPLNHMIGALVTGWKSEGNWPPQPMPETAVSRRKTKKGESAFQKWKREQGAKKKAGVAGSEYQPEAEEPEHKNIRKSITGVVKKAFGRKSDEDEAAQDLESLGITFEADERNEELEGALANGHI